ncbi:MAG: hypothetical protein KDC61_01675, partial [Saprospiraceae bacterium]|nr:hypothetical protein [Saprospiraceae bacterium]
MKNVNLIGCCLIWIALLGSGIPLSAQRTVQEYKMKNLISNVVLQKFEQINKDVEVFEHKEGNRLVLIGDSTQIEQAISELEML